jgi:hypothetical protein
LIACFLAGLYNNADLLTEISQYSLKRICTMNNSRLAIKAGVIITILSSCLWGMAMADTPARTSDSKSESELRQELWVLVAELRELRTDHYKKQSRNTEQIKQFGDVSAKLEIELKELRSNKENLDKSLASTQAEIQKVQSENEKNKSVESSTAKKLESFISRQTEEIEKGIPYRKNDRFKRLNGTGSIKQTSMKDQSISDMFGRVWSFSQEEIRIARSGETFTDQVQVDEGRLQYARLFRVGHLILGYLIEQDGQTGIWVDGTGWKKTTKSEAESIRQAVNIIDRKQAPKHIQLPVYTKPVVQTEGKVRINDL